jgi:hypothetical protein
METIASLDRSRPWLVSLGVAFACCLALGSVVVLQRARLWAAVAKKSPPRSPADQWGIEPVSIRTSAGGYLLDFRYRVVDSEKAKALFDPRVKASLVDAATGKSLTVSQDAKLGALRASPRSAPVNGKEYYVLFSNAGRLQKGSRAAVALGDCTLPDLVVQ